LRHPARQRLPPGVGTEGGIYEMTALGDNVNMAARLAAAAGRGEIVMKRADLSQRQSRLYRRRARSSEQTSYE
jgi:class 3 adenylate cyclase